MAEKFTELLSRFTAAVESGDGRALATLFTADGTYHDTFYGAFQGPDAIRDMLENRFWGDAEAFLWDMFEPVFDPAAQIGYARWVFSYTSTMKDSAGKRVAFNGMSQFRMTDGRIAFYREVFSAGVALVQLDMAPARIDKILRRELDGLSGHPEWSRHLPPEI